MEKEVSGQKIIQTFEVVRVPAAAAGSNSQKPPPPQPSVVAGNNPQTAAPSPQPAVNPPPVPTPANQIGALLFEAEQSVAKKNYEEAIQRTKRVFAMVDVPLADLKRAQLIQDDAYTEWVARLREQMSRLDLETQSLALECQGIQNTIATAQAKTDSGNNSNYRPMGIQSDISFATLELKRVGTKLFQKQAELATINSRITTVSEARSQAKLDAAEAVRRARP